MRLSPPEDCALSKKFPTVVEFLSTGCWEDGKARSLGTISLSWGDSVFRACLNDHDSGNFTFVSGRSLTSLLMALERAITSESTEWRKSTYSKNKKPKGGA